MCDPVIQRGNTCLLPCRAIRHSWSTDAGVPLHSPSAAPMTFRSRAAFLSVALQESREKQSSSSSDSVCFLCYLQLTALLWSRRAAVLRGHWCVPPGHRSTSGEAQTDWLEKSEEWAERFRSLCEVENQSASHETFKSRQQKKECAKFQI